MRVRVLLFRKIATFDIHVILVSTILHRVLEGRTKSDVLLARFAIPSVN